MMKSGDEVHFCAKTRSQTGNHLTLISFRNLHHLQPVSISEPLVIANDTFFLFTRRKAAAAAAGV